MDKQIALLAEGLRMAEKAHANYERREKTGEVILRKVEWPEFYARWLIDNAHIWSPHHCADGSCEVDHD